ncbi:phage baseplate assembly protein V [Winogradskya humida]|uniref:Gp5/Type VI secretion system Vgr protein OB-fold domain-containing protein n=1 Tax=Winogradskya humida TaxID=113566 RepID=A0ABQ3ZYT6_9ACTN|nr:phage baseplate assembly protein V [Actinoplanes humidus]GIE23634.1 hypothetical protein Ahu01nite_067360 [Actinoplanes humidus]
MADRYFGKYSGVVKDNRDTGALGVVLVSVPAVFPEDDTVPARAALPYGMFFVPENETHVWVEFEGGDTSAPLWTGVQHVPGSWAPEAAKNPPTVRAVRTASGHLLIFDDTEGSESIVLSDGRNAHRLAFTAGGITLTDGVNGHRIAMTSSAIEVAHAGGATVTLEAAAVTAAAGAAKVELTGGIVRVDGSAVLLGAGATQVLHLGDQGIGNLGGPVPITTTQSKVFV